MARVRTTGDIYLMQMMFDYEVSRLAADLTDSRDKSMLRFRHQQARCR